MEYVLYSTCQNFSRFIVDWDTLDATILKWIYATISIDLLHTIIESSLKAMEAWKRLHNIFQDNEDSSVVTLEQEFLGTHMFDFSSASTYCEKLKNLADQLRNVGAPVNDNFLTRSPPPYPLQRNTRSRLLGSRPSSPSWTTNSKHEAYTTTDIEQAMHTLGLNPPDTDWYMDTGSTSHMSSDRVLCLMLLCPLTSGTTHFKPPPIV
ncbi:hypothetical protein LIER_07526 [Lithospermum erythrorhizon]|uniref:Uncharacterized protein n=1 Tax=Lithospermum erythrorhizon TaxID=34254 RepID=A0AAV3PBA3_LITER